MLKMVKFYAFSDESNYNKGEHRSLAMIMFNESIINSFEKEFKKILNDYNQTNIKSFKWTEMKTSHKITALKEILEILFEYMENDLVYVETIKWSTLDERHNIPRRDDKLNLSIMYYRLISDLVSKKTTTGDEVTLYSDHNNIMAWEELEKYIIYADGCANEKEIEKFGVILATKKVNILEKTTSQKNLIQLADIFAGIARTSFEDYDKYEKWNNSHQNQLTKSESYSNRQKYRFEIYEIIDKWAKKNKLQISLKGNRGFRSYNPNSPLNFWVYEPQHENDKAPVKKQKMWLTFN